MYVSLSVEEVQTFFSLIAEDRIQQDLDGAKYSTPGSRLRNNTKSKPFQHTELLNNRGGWNVVQIVPKNCMGQPLKLNLGSLAQEAIHEASYLSDCGCTALVDDKEHMLVSQ